MNDIQKKTYIDKDETDSMEKNKHTVTQQPFCITVASSTEFVIILRDA